jgi:hypothetical protein
VAVASDFEAALCCGLAGLGLPWGEAELPPSPEDAEMAVIAERSERAADTERRLELVTNGSRAGARGERTES